MKPQGPPRVEMEKAPISGSAKSCADGRLWPIRCGPIRIGPIGLSPFRFRPNRLCATSSTPQVLSCISVLSSGSQLQVLSCKFSVALFRVANSKVHILNYKFSFASLVRTALPGTAAFRETPLPETAQMFAFFVSLQPPNFVFYDLSGGLLVEFWLCLKPLRRGREHSFFTIPRETCHESSPDVRHCSGPLRTV